MSSAVTVCSSAVARRAVRGDRFGRMKRIGPGLNGPVLLIGSGLVGTSVGLALRRQAVAVHLRDRDRVALRIAVSRGAGWATAPSSPPRLVVVAVPPDQVAAAVGDSLREWPETVVTDVSSVKVQPLMSLVKANVDLRRYVGSQPMAGSERSGPMGSTSDLFVRRAWAVTPHHESNEDAVAAVHALVRLCGAEPITMTPHAHDAAVARVSHLPHVLAVLAAARLHEAPGEDLRLSGQGLRDVTRIAAGDPALWRQILTANAGSLVGLLTEVRADLDSLISEIGSDGPAVDGLLHRGRAGTQAIPRMAFAQIQRGSRRARPGVADQQGQGAGQLMP